MRLPTGMGFEVDTDDEDSGLATFVDESNAVATVASKPSASRDDGEEPTYVTATVVPPVEAPAMHVDAAHARVEPDPAPLLSPPMVVPTYPPAAPYATPYAAPQQPPSPQPRPMPELAAGSSALRHDAMAARFGDASNVMATGRRGDTSDELLPARRKLPMPLIAGAGGVVAILLVVVIVLAARGGKSGSGDKSSERATAKTVAAVDHGTKGSSSEPGSATEPERPDPQSSAESGSNGVASTGTPPATGGKKPPPTGAGTGSASEPPPPVGRGSAATVVPTQIPSPPPAVARRPAQTLGGKKVVLEYDTTPPPKQPPKKVAAVSPAVVDENAVRAARTAYFNGNKKLFAGDANGAIKLYQQALNVYPGYVAGYRGLGLAYAQNGDKKNALKAFRTYMTAVPTAKDIALIKRRVATLQR